MKSNALPRRAEPVVAGRGLENLRALIALSKLDASINDDRRSMRSVSQEVVDTREKADALAAGVESKRKQLASVVTLPPDVTPLAPPPDPQVLREAFETAEREWQDALDVADEREKSSKTALAALQKHISELETGRPELLAKSPRELLSMYEHAMASGRFPAMVPLVDTCCSACNLSLPLHMVYGIRHGNQVIRCQHCKRLLYSESWFDEEAEKTDATEKAKR